MAKKTTTHPIPTKVINSIAKKLTNIEGLNEQLDFGNAKELVSKLANEHAMCLIKERVSIVSEISEAGHNIVSKLVADLSKGK